MIASSLQFGRIGLCDRNAGHPERFAAQIFQELFTGDSIMNCKHKKCPLLGVSSIPLTQGKFASIDDSDYAWLSRFRWRAQWSKDTQSFYVVRSSSRKISKRQTILMSREILGLMCGDKKQADHRNHNTLDNRRANLRTCSRSENNRNRLPRSNCSSSYKGVTWNKDKGKWQAQITLNSRCRFLGCFKVETDAAHAYDAAARKLFGEFAYTNFPEEHTTNE